MNKQEVKVLENLLGRVVYSNAGRDKGNLFVVIKEIDEIIFWLLTAKKRKIENSKKKKKKTC